MKDQIEVRSRTSEAQCCEKKFYRYMKKCYLNSFLYEMQRKFKKSSEFWE